MTRDGHQPGYQLRKCRRETRAHESQLGSNRRTIALPAIALEDTETTRADHAIARHTHTEAADSALHTTQRRSIGRISEGRSHVDALCPTHLSLSSPRLDRTCRFAPQTIPRA